MLNPVDELRRISHELITVVAKLQGEEIFGGFKLSEDFCQRMNKATNWIETEIEILLLEEQH